MDAVLGGAWRLEGPGEWIQTPGHDREITAQGSNRKGMARGIGG